MAGVLDLHLGGPRRFREEVLPRGKERQGRGGRERVGDVRRGTKGRQGHGLRGVLRLC